MNNTKMEKLSLNNGSTQQQEEMKTVADIDSIYPDCNIETKIPTTNNENATKRIRNRTL
jgi:hypothetical protein